MARIELRDCIVRIKDGLSGTAAISESMVAAGDSSMGVGTIVLNTDDTDLIPIGARFTVASEMGSPVHVVTARTPSTSGPTTEITFSPILAMGVADAAVITFLPQQVEIKIGDGNVTWTENKDYEYLLDRGNLDTVRENDQQPLDVTIDFVYEFVTTGTDETISPYDAFKGIGGAAEWVSASSDACEPYAVDVEITHTPPCGGAETEITLFPDFRFDTIEADLSEATFSATGRCNATAPTITREAQS